MALQQQLEALRRQRSEQESALAVSSAKAESIEAELAKQKEKQVRKVLTVALGTCTLSHLHPLHTAHYPSQGTSRQGSSSASAGRRHRSHGRRCGG